MQLSEVHQTLQDWVTALSDQHSPISFAHDFQDSDGQLIVSALATGMTADPMRKAGQDRRFSGRRPLALARYVIAVGGPRAEAEHTLLGLLCKAQQSPGFTISADPPSPAWWLALGLKPRPAFVLEAALSEFVSASEAPMVRRHEAQLAPMGSLPGRVIASDDTPLAFAQVQILATGQQLRCDAAGEFRIAISDQEDQAKSGWVRVQARGVEQRFAIPARDQRNQPWLLRLKQL